MCSYWLRTWRPIKKTPYVIFYCLSLKIILCMLILCVMNNATGKNSLCAWIVCVTLYLMFISFLCTLLLCQCVCMFVMSVFSSSYIYSIISVKLCSIKFLLNTILKVFHCFHHERLQFTQIHIRIACLFLMTLSLFRSIKTCQINYKGLPII